MDAGRGTVGFKPLPETRKENTSKEMRTPQDQKMSAAPGNIYFFHSDHLGTGSFLTDASGHAYQFFTNLPFGETMIEQHSGTEDYENRWKFNGKELDTETGLYYYGARYYDPSVSIWMSVDPLAEKFPAWNPYNYTMQNPINLIDPDGMAPGSPDDIRIYNKNNKETAVIVIQTDKIDTDIYLEQDILPILKETLIAKDKPFLEIKLPKPLNEALGLYLKSEKNEGSVFMLSAGLEATLGVGKAVSFDVAIFSSKVQTTYTTEYDTYGLDLGGGIAGGLLIPKGTSKITPFSIDGESTGYNGSIFGLSSTRIDTPIYSGALRSYGTGLKFGGSYFNANTTFIGGWFPANTENELKENYDKY